MKLCLSICRFSLFFFLSINSLLAQSNTNFLSEDTLIVKLVEKSNGLSNFSFRPSAEFKEDQTMAQVKRYESITESSITFEYRNGKLVIDFDRTKFDDKLLEDFISGLVVTHGSKNYSIRK